MANGIEEHGARLTTVENEVGKLREWRHGTYTENHNGLLLRQLNLEQGVARLELALAQLSAGWAKFWEVAKPIVISLALAFIGWLGWLLLQLYHAYPRK